MAGYIMGALLDNVHPGEREPLACLIEKLTNFFALTGSIVYKINHVQSDIAANEFWRRMTGV